MTTRTAVIVFVALMLAGGRGFAQTATESILATLPCDQTQPIPCPDGDGINQGLMQASDSIFYGTAAGGGTYGSGTVFGVSPNGAITVPHQFLCGEDECPSGSPPSTGLVEGTSGLLYGLTSDGGPQDEGTFFFVSPPGIYTVLGASGGGIALILGADGNFYGAEGGAVIKLTPQGNQTLLYIR